MVARVQIGFLPSADYGIRVSKPGVDVTTAALADLVFATDFQEYAVVHQAGEIALDTTSDEVVTFPALGYAPMCITFGSLDSGATWQSLLFKYNSNLSNDSFPRITTETDRITVHADSSRGHGSYLVRYIILRVVGA